MKKILGVIVLGLLLSSCATKVGLNNNSDNNKYVAKTSMVPLGQMDSSEGSEYPNPVTGFMGDLATFWSLGIISPKYYDFYE